MAHVLLIHWDWSELIDLAGELERHGTDVITESDDGVRALRMALENPPYAVLISLRLAAKHGRDVALAIRDHPAADAPPLLFFDGDEKARRRITKVLPTATIISWEDVPEALLELAALNAK